MPPCLPVDYLKLVLSMLKMYPKVDGVGSFSCREWGYSISQSLGKKLLLELGIVIDLGRRSLGARRPWPIDRREPLALEVE